MLISMVRGSGRSQLSFFKGATCMKAGKLFTFDIWDEAAQTLLAAVKIQDGGWNT